MLFSKKLCAVYTLNFTCLIKLICVDLGHFFWIFDGDQAGEHLTLISILWPSAWFEDFLHAPSCTSSTIHEAKSQSVSPVLCLTIHTPPYTSENSSSWFCHSAALETHT